MIYKVCPDSDRPFLWSHHRHFKTNNAIQLAISYLPPPAKKKDGLKFGFMEKPC